MRMTLLQVAATRSRTLNVSYLSRPIASSRRGENLLVVRCVETIQWNGVALRAGSLAFDALFVRDRAIQYVDLLLQINDLLDDFGRIFGFSILRRESSSFRATVVPDLVQSGDMIVGHAFAPS